MPACCQALLKNLAKALQTLPVQSATICLPQTMAQRGSLPLGITHVHKWNNLRASLLIDSCASAINMVASRWHGLLAEEQAGGTWWIIPATAASLFC